MKKIFPTYLLLLKLNSLHLHLTVHKLDGVFGKTLDVNAKVLLCTGLVNVTERHEVVIGKRKEK